MPFEVKMVVLLAGLSAGLILLGGLIWSITIPGDRFWPPGRATLGVKLRVWLLTIGVFSSAFVLGIYDWNRFDWPAGLRWGAGLPLILIGHVVVWSGVFEIGMKATSGEAATLETDGLYALSRNPQYVADILILTGWAVLAASAWALPVVVTGILVLIAAPFAEEGWLEETYGEPYRRYKSRVRRFI